MSTPNTNRPVKVPGHPGIYRRGRRYMIRYRVGKKIKSQTFATLAEAVKYKADRATHRSKGWEFVERVEVEMSDVTGMSLSAWGSDGRPVCKLVFAREAEVVLAAAVANALGIEAEVTADGLHVRVGSAS